MKILIVSLISVVLSFNQVAFAQDLSDVKVKMEGYNQKKFNHPPKKIFLQTFMVNYQKVMISYAKAKSGNTYGSAVAGLALGLDRVENAKLQAMTDKLFLEFKSILEAAGYEIMSNEEVKSYKHFEDWGELKGGEEYMDLLTDGYLTTIPNGYNQLSGKVGMFNFAGNVESGALDGAIVARVNITVPFAESQSINGGLVGGVAKITAKADLRISPIESIPAKGDFKKPTMLSTDMSFVFKESLKWQAFHRAKLKEPIEIEGVIDEKKKYKTTSVATSGTGFTTLFSEAYSENAVLVPCDEEKYIKGVSEAMSTYIKTGTDEFVSFIK